MATIETVMPKVTAKSEFKGFWLIFAVSFMVFLSVALAGQLFGRHWRSWLPGAEGVDSIFGGVKAAVYTFMSHIL